MTLDEQQLYISQKKDNLLNDFNLFLENPKHDLKEWIHIFDKICWTFGHSNLAAFQLYKDCIKNKKIPKEYQLDVLTFIYTDGAVDGTIGTCLNKALNNADKEIQLKRIEAFKNDLSDKFISENELIAYRGQSMHSLHCEKAISYTTDYDKALEFANINLSRYYDINNAYVYTVKVNVEDIGIYYNGREEHELLVRPITKNAKTEILNVEIIHRQKEDE